MIINHMTNETGQSVPNQFIIRHKGVTIFQSYESVIVRIDRDESVTLDQNKWDYSSTTSKYRDLFLGEKKSVTLKKIKSGEYKLSNLNDREN